VAQATPDTAEPKAGHHAGAHGTGRYWVVWFVLLCFTVLTVVSGRMTGNIFIAMAIAVIKASLVVLFFMHMTEAAGTNRIVFVTSFLFLVVMMIGVFGDLWTRNEMSLPSSVPSTEGPEIQVPEGAGAPAHHE
jgi:cytochrome c oxidase subunit IV